VPSPYESLSLLALEAFAVGTPVLANARSEVLVEHCRRSNAGLYYADRWEFTEAVNLLLGDDRLRAAMGRNGQAYINRHYRWSTILTKYERLFTRLRGQTRDGAAAPAWSGPRAAAAEGPRESRERGRDGARGPGREGSRDRGRDGRRDQARGDRRRDRSRSSSRPRR
jgi:hypothetical protein